MNLQEQISRIQNMIRVISEEELPADADSLIRSLPDELKELFFKQWDAKQNPKWHPEGNSLKHIIVVIKRAYHHYPDDPNMIMAALFHDLGKMDTYDINPKTGQPTAYGHENKSTEYVEQFRDWIESFDGTDVDEIKYLVKNHMKVKPSTWDSMRDIKKEPIQTHPSFDKLMGFTNKLDGGGTEIEKGEMKEEELTEKCWPGYTQKGMKTMFGKRYPNCVKKKKLKESENIIESNFDTADKFIKLIEERGLWNTIKIFGNFQSLLDVVGEKFTEDIKIKAIKDLTKKYDGISLFALGENGIIYRKQEDTEKEISYLGTSKAVIDVFDLNGNHEGEFSIHYENLPSKILNLIIEVLYKNLKELDRKL